MAVEGDPVLDRAVPSRAPAQTRGFLFADIRGYTEYVEREGAGKAADLLGRYRPVVRAAIAEHAGAEIRTEGDSFFVVLPSASAAVLCAVSIVQRVEEANGSEPANPIRVGIGVHAGEALDTDEGLVGSAVNIAARLSAIAKPGEVLVSETVRTLTRSVVPVTYVSRGRHRLKGVAEPQEIFAVVPLGAPAVTRLLRRPRVLVVAAVGVAALVLVPGLVYMALPAASLPGRSAGPSQPAATATGTSPLVAGVTPTPPLPTGSAPTGSPGPTVIQIDREADPLFGGMRSLAAGSYRYDSFRPILVFEIAPAWTDRTWYPVLALSEDSSLFAIPAGTDKQWDYNREGIKPGMVLLSFLRLQTVFSNPCDPGDTTTFKLLGGGVRDVDDWLSGHQFLAATNHQTVSLLGWSGFSVDVTVKGDPGEQCAGAPHQGSVHLFKTTRPEAGYGSVISMRDGEQARWTVLDIGEETPLILMLASRSEAWARALAWSQDLIGTITVADQ